MFAIALLLVPSGTLFAQNASGSGESGRREIRSNQLSISLATPLFQLGLARGERWRSAIRMVNANPYPITIYASVSSFSQEGENGQPRFSFLDLTAISTTTNDLSGWITVPRGPILIPADSTGEIPVSINIPDDASPGGHYAAVLVGTQPPDLKGESGVAIGSVLSALFLVRVPGEVIEAGDIRDFYATRQFLDRPEVTLELRFENTGNVHIIPQGEIVIRNLWGKERGKIQINDTPNSGNVLPNSVRKFVFAWKGEAHTLEFGPYTAVVTLAYGTEVRKHLTRETTFWIVPWKPILATLLTLVLSLWVIVYAIRRYVRRVVAIERERLGIAPNAPPTREKVVLSIGMLARPIAREMERLSEVRKSQEHTRFVRLWAILRENAFFFFFVFTVLTMLSLLGWYFSQVLSEERAYEMREIHEP